LREGCVDGTRFLKILTIDPPVDHFSRCEIFYILKEAQVLIEKWHITDRKQAEDKLTESKKHYCMLFNAIDEGFCIIEVIFDENEKPIDYRFIEVNPSFEKQTGLINAQGKRMRELAPKHEEHWFEIYGKIALTGQPARFVNRAEQLHRWYDVYAFRFGQPENRQVAILFNDITERKQAGDVLREHDIQFKKLSSWVPGMIYQFTKRLDGTYCVPFTTEAIKDIFGCSPQDVREDFSPMARVILPEDFDKVISSIEDSAKHLTIWACECRVQIPG